MKQTIAICKKNEDNGLTVIGENKVTTFLDEQAMEVKAKYNGKTYTLQGNAFFPYIVID